MAHSLRTHHQLYQLLWPLLFWSLLLKGSDTSWTLGLGETAR